MKIPMNHNDGKSLIVWKFNRKTRRVHKIALARIARNKGE